MTRGSEPGSGGGPAIVVHADEACLRNGMPPPNPGGAGGLVEVSRRGGVERRDFWVSEPDTTNNRMAIRSAIVALELLGAKGRPLELTFVSDSEYLVKGMREWVPEWIRRGWRRRTGAVENVELWQRLVELARPHTIRWKWVRGHRGHPQNEYANFLATRAAREGSRSEGLVESGYFDFLENIRDR